MITLWAILPIVLLFVLVGIGFAVIAVFAYPLASNSVHEERVAYVDVMSKEARMWFHIKLKTNDLFCAFNPIEVAVKTGAVAPDIRSIQIEFVGASQYFPSDYDFSDPTEFEKYMESVRANIIILGNDSLTTFAGNKSNLVFTYGGEFDVGITLTNRDGSVEGYGVGNTDFALKGAIHISPPEALNHVISNNLTLGLTYVAVGLALIAVGVAGLFDLWFKLLGI
jgi:hypothetical protein